jgi:hypothetical protein
MAYGERNRRTINEPGLRRNIAPTRGRATLSSHGDDVTPTTVRRARCHPDTCATLPPG